jgi:signal peptidase I
MSKTDDTKRNDLAAYRDTAQSIWVSIILAFVLRAFVVEAFVIPTGSMAPTLLGEHWSLTCPTCGYQFAFGGAREVVLAGSDPRLQQTPPVNSRCPNCRYPYPADAQRKYLDNGDRVLVLKYLYEFAEPQPWDVVVFKNPQDNRQNYIKRLIGLPGEIIEIVHGDVFVAKAPPLDQASTPISEMNLDWRIRRKPHRVQQEMWQVVFDNDYQPSATWAAAAQSPTWKPLGEWTTTNFEREFHYRGPDSGTLEFNAPAEAFRPEYGYNSDQLVLDDVVGDLRLACVFEPREKSSQVTLQMATMGFDFRAMVDASGKVSLSCVSQELPDGQWQVDGTIAPLGGQHSIELTYVDFLATLWIDGEAVLTSEGANSPPNPYEWIKRRLKESSIPTPKLSILAANGQCVVKHVQVCRDVFYTTHKLSFQSPSALDRYARAIDAAHSNDPARTRRLDENNPFFRPVQGSGWGNMGKPIWLRKYDRSRAELDEFFVLGDNSPQSLDSRGWVQASPTLRLYDANGGFLYQLGTVPRYNMIGRAFFVYWPAGFRIPGVPRLPLVPNVGKMRLIR